jgi:hypothetical protein
MDNLSDLLGDRQSDLKALRDDLTRNSIVERRSTASNDSSSSSASSQKEICYEVLPIWTQSARRTRQMSRKTLEVANVQASTTKDFEDSETAVADEDEVKQTWMVQPGSAKHIAWDIIGFMFIAWDSVYIPLEWFDPPDHVFSTFMEWLVRLYWTLAIPFYFFYRIYRQSGRRPDGPEKGREEIYDDLVWYGFHVGRSRLDRGFAELRDGRASLHVYAEESADSPHCAARACSEGSIGVEIFY